MDKQYLVLELLQVVTFSFLITLLLLVRSVHVEDFHVCFFNMQRDGKTVLICPNMAKGKGKCHDV